LVGFPCTRCGACCRKAGSSPELVRLGFAEPGGACKHLVNNECAIYETRPDVCRIDAVRVPYLAQADYYEATRRVCNLLMNDEGAPPEFRIPVEALKRR
jgi:uncharacterized protein